MALPPLQSRVLQPSVLRPEYVDGLAGLDREIFADLNLAQQTGGILDDRIDPELAESIDRLVAALNENPKERDVLDALVRLEGRHATLALLRSSFRAYRPDARKQLLDTLRNLGKADSEAYRVIREAYGFEIRAVAQVAQEVFVDIALPEELLRIAVDQNPIAAIRLRACDRMLSAASPDLGAIEPLLDLVEARDPMCGRGSLEPVVNRISGLQVHYPDEVLIAKVVTPFLRSLGENRLWGGNVLDKDMDVRNLLLQGLSRLPRAAHTYLSLQLNGHGADRPIVYLLGKLARSESWAIDALLDLIDNQSDDRSAKWAAERLKTVGSRLSDEQRRRVVGIQAGVSDERIQTTLEEIVAGDKRESLDPVAVFGELCEVVEYEPELTFTTPVKDAVYRLKSAILSTNRTQLLGYELRSPTKPSARRAVLVALDRAFDGTVALRAIQPNLEVLSKDEQLWALDILFDKIRNDLKSGMAGRVRAFFDQVAQASREASVSDRAKLHIAQMNSPQ